MVEESINPNNKKFYVNIKNRCKVRNCTNWIIECKCGCGNTLTKYNKYGHAREYIKGHVHIGRKRSEATTKLLGAKFKGQTRTCLYFNECGQTETHDGFKWTKKWHHYENNNNNTVLCGKHFKRIVIRPRRMTYKNTRPHLKEIVRIAQCSICGNKVGDEYIDSRGRIKKTKFTHRHHREYHDDDVLKDTIEVCQSCHLKEHKRLKKLKEEPKRCAKCGSTTTTIQKKRYPSGKIIEFERWDRDPFNKKDWLCMECYWPIWWQYLKAIGKDKKIKKRDN
jgi:hypothetical protein